MTIYILLYLMRKLNKLKELANDLKKKILRKFKFTATAAILAFGVGIMGYSQNTSQAVMTIRVTVVSWFDVTENTISNINNQIAGNDGRV